jgi:hypothetical protein
MSLARRAGNGSSEAFTHGTPQLASTCALNLWSYKGGIESQLGGKIVAIEVESADYFTRETVLDAANKAWRKHPDKVFHSFRISFPAVYAWR